MKNKPYEWRKRCAGENGMLKPLLRIVLLDIQWLQTWRGMNLNINVYNNPVSDVRHSKGEKGSCLAERIVIFSWWRTKINVLKLNQNTSFYSLGKCCIKCLKSILHLGSCYTMGCCCVYIIALTLNCYSSILLFFVSVDPRILRGELRHMGEFGCYHFNK